MNNDIQWNGEDSVWGSVNCSIDDDGYLMINNSNHLSARKASDGEWLFCYNNKLSFGINSSEIHLFQNTEDVAIHIYKEFLRKKDRYQGFFASGSEIDVIYTSTIHKFIFKTINYEPSMEWEGECPSNFLDLKEKFNSIKEMNIFL